MTERNLESNRANAQNSTGPRTEDGKRRSSFNGFKFGLYSKVHFCAPADAEAFQAHCAAYRAELAPAGAIEADLVHQIAIDRWRLKRAAALEDSIFVIGIQRHAGDFDSGDSIVDNALAEGQTWLDQSAALTRLSQYEQRVLKSIEKNTAALEARQQARSAAGLPASGAGLPACAAEAPSQPSSPAARSQTAPAPPAIGFAFQPAETAPVQPFTAAAPPPNRPANGAALPEAA